MKSAEPYILLVKRPKLDEKLADAKEYGADITYKWPQDGDAKAVAKGLVKATGGPLDGIIDMVCSTSTKDRSMLALNGGGTYVLVGLDAGPLTDISLFEFIAREITFRSVNYGTMAQSQELLQLVADGKVRAPSMTFIKLEDVPETLKKLGDGKQRGRAVVKHSED